MKCPLCHHAITPDSIFAKYGAEINKIKESEIIKDANGKSTITVNIFNKASRDHSNEDNLVESSNLYKLFMCPNCKRDFFEIHRYDHISNKFITELYPKIPENTKFGYEISELSPNFIKCYNQALIAEGQNLDEIHGSGYRKSLEYLIKDFAASFEKDIDTKETIYSNPSLANIINNKLSNIVQLEELVEIAKRSWWLGSDYVHTHKKYEKNDIEDLKNCINLTVGEINHYISREKYKAAITKTK